MPTDEDSGSDYFPQPTPASGTRQAPVAPPYRRQRTEEVDTGKIREEAAADAQRDLILKQMHKKLNKLDSTQDTVVRSLAKGDRRMDKIDHKFDLHQTEVTSQLKAVGDKLDGHLEQHKVTKSRWSGVAPQIIATVIASIITAGVVGLITAAMLPTKKDLQPDPPKQQPQPKTP